mmetsp:Transcript_49869/g.132458  ORF Transcript_49869/g.132458 Transcript_49869/m.132458 type:complete len:204 (-) Transcript_49869:567-1178(-)
MRSEMRESNCLCVASRPSAKATGPSTWAKAARTDCAESSPRVENWGMMWAWRCSVIKGTCILMHGSITRTASFLTSCSLSFNNCMKGAMRCCAIISGPNAAQKASKFLATVKRTRHERSSAASLMTETVCSLFSSTLNTWAMTSVVCTQATLIVSWVSSVDNCLYTAMTSVRISCLSHTDTKSLILCAAARLTMGVSSVHSVL